MTTLSMMPEQPPLGFLNPGTISEDPPLLAVDDTFSSEFWSSLQEEDYLPATLPAWNAEDHSSSISSSDSYMRNDQPTIAPDRDGKEPNVELCNMAECRLDGSPTDQLDCPQRRSSSNSKRSSNGGRNRRKSSTYSSTGSDTHRDENPNKRAKFLERNRIAASRCRQKKKERTMALETRYQEQCEKKDALVAEFGRLRAEALGLKNEVLKHADCGDKSIRLHIARSAMTITDTDIAPESANTADCISSPETSASSMAQAGLTFSSPDQLRFDQSAAKSSRAHTRQYSDASQGSVFDGLSMGDNSNNLITV